MLYEKDIYGQEGVVKSPAGEAEIERETEMELLSELGGGPDGEPPAVGMKIDKAAQTVTLYNRLTNEILFHTSIADYDNLLREREIRRRAGREKQKEN